MDRCELDLQDKVVLVSGGSRGIGAEIVRECAHRGAHVAFSYISSDEAAHELLDVLTHEGGQNSSYRAYKSNSADFAQCGQLVNQVIADFERLDVVVNNAGITRDGLAIKMSEENFRAVIDTNLTGAFALAQSAAKYMIKQRSGSIINISSVAGLMGNAGQANYAAAKAGLIGLTKTLARELAPRMVRVNAVAPGFIETDMTSALPPRVREAAADLIPLKCFGAPSDIAAAVAFLATDAARYITGVTLPVDGGMSM